MAAAQVSAEISALATTYIRVPVSTDSNGEAVNPSSYPVQLAFISEFAERDPENADWQTASWSTIAQSTYAAQCLVGPNGGAVTLTANTAYSVWIMVDASPQTFIANTGQIQAT